MTKTHLFKLLAIITLIVFAASCRQPHAAQAEEDSDVIEQMLAIDVNQLTPDSVHVLLDAIWAENEHRMTDYEKAAFYNERGLAYMTAHRFEAAETNLLKSLQYLERLNGSLNRRAIIMLNIGGIRMRQGALEKAVDIFRQAALYAYGDAEFMRKLYINKGQVFAAKGEIDSSLYYTQLALDIAAKEENSSWKASALSNLSHLFFNLQQFSEAEENLRRAILIFREMNNQRRLWISYYHLSLVLFRQDKMEETLYYARKSNEIAAAMGLPQIGMVLYYQHRARLYFAEGDYRNSLAMTYQALELQTKMQDTRVIAELEERIAVLYTRMGNLDQALVYAIRALGTAQENRIYRLEMTVQQTLSVIYAKRGEIDNFMAAIGAERRLRDKLFSEENSRALHEMQTRYEREIDQLLIAQKTKDIQRQRIIIYLVAFAGFVIIISLVYAYFMQRRKIQNTIRIVRQYESLSALKKETEQQNKDTEKTLKQNGVEEKLLYDFQQLLESEKIYRRQGFDLDTAAKMLNSNRSYLSRAINQSKHKNFTEYINLYRVEEAVEIIKEQNRGGNNYTIQTVSEIVGFGNRTSFYDAFKQVVGVTPIEYKKIINEQETE